MISGRRGLLDVLGHLCVLSCFIAGISTMSGYDSVLWCSCWLRQIGVSCIFLLLLSAAVDFLLKGCSLDLGSQIFFCLACSVLLLGVAELT
jgi:hypothetical protein